MSAAAYSTEQLSGNLEITWGRNSKPCMQEVINQWETVNQKRTCLQTSENVMCIEQTGYFREKEVIIPRRQFLYF